MRASSKRDLYPEQVLEDVREIVERKFPGRFDVSLVDFEGIQVSSRERPEHHGDLEYTIWVTKTKRRIEHKHCVGHFMEWISCVIQRELATKWKGRCSDDGVAGTWDPDTEKYPTFQSWLDAMWWRSKEESPEGFKQMVELEQRMTPRWAWEGKA